MTILFVVLPLTLLISAGAVAAFVWAARSGQLDDLTTPALRMLADDGPGDPAPPDPSRGPDL
ncbi:MAG: cbb3-type cytochrome oxidase assembly protein CcoS [Pseudomonadota bacterium]|nr:MAG: cbb3-type cytochrome oxidase assembly protein CcoS [Pseudomonadota bacterium]